MISKTDKFNILLVLIIIIIISFCLFQKIENFPGRNKLDIFDRRLNRNFLANSICANDHDLFFIGNMNYGDNQNIYFMNHDLRLEKLKIKDVNIEDKIPKIVFKIKFFSGRNMFTIQKVVVKPDGDTIPPGTPIRHLTNARYIPYRFIPHPGMKRRINGNLKYFMINVNNDLFMLERSHSYFIPTIITSLNEKHKHIFFLIPYYTRTNIQGTGISQGCNAIWNFFN